MRILNKKKIIILILITVVAIISWLIFYRKWMQDLPSIKEIRLEHKITVPEGFSVWQIGSLLAKKEKIKNIDNPREFWLKYRNLEGFLFPDTYRLFQDTNEEEVLDRFKNNFLKRINGLSDINNGREYSNFEEAISNPELVKIITIASIIEREAKRDEDRDKIAGVYFNRLKIGKKLEADPTVQYGRDIILLEKNENINNFESWQAITKADYRDVDSIYNTYLHSGLPPSPICNPGLKSIKAVLSPEEHNYYYFFNLSDGSTIYSRTEEEHNQNKIKYKNER